MTNLAIWALALVAPFLKRALFVLGIGTVTYAAITPLVQSVVSNVAASYGAIPAGIAQFLDLVGAGQAFGIIAGALVARVSFLALSKMGKVAA